MGMSGGSGETASGKAIADINVTPMVDIMLVLLIIFMVVTPLFTVRVVALRPGQDQRISRAMREEADRR